MAPRGREGKESAWVKKTPAGAAPADKVKEPENGEDREGVSKGREGGKGKGRKGERPRREARGEEDGDGKSKGRGKGKHKKGAGAEAVGPNSGDEEEMDEHAAAIMKMLRAGGPKIIRYEKGQLLSISRLAASNVKPDLDPLIDKDNKDSVLLTRIATGREKHEEGEGAQQEEEGSRRRSKATGAAVGAAGAAGAGRDDDREAAPAAAELTEGDAAAAEEDEEGKRAFEKWLGRNMPKLEAMSKATPSSGSTNWSSTLPAAALGAGKAGSSASPSAAQAALLQQQALAGSLEGRNAAHAMQAAAYMQAMTQMQAAAAAARQSSYSQMPWNSYNAYMNPYMNAYGSGYGSLDPYAALQQQAAAANLSEAMQAKLANLTAGQGQLNQLATSQAARNMATVVKAAAQAKLQAAKAVPKTPGAPAAAKASKASAPKSAPAPKPQASPKQRPAAPSAAGLVVPKKPSAPSPSPAPNAPAAGVPAEAPAPKAEAVPKSAPAEGEVEDEAGCSQS
ncbi:unnamed protein product [Symbiodinium sp. KB8]|nr:unnamed protein product [Symbiodinium sp. KB8]